MTPKTPVPSPDELPTCFGDRYRDDDSVCRKCRARAECSLHTAAWSNKRSLSERLVELRASLTHESPEGIEAVYTRLFRETFGRRPFLDSAKHVETLSRIAKLCADKGIDVETYIAGNMWAMKRWADSNPRIGFQPTHLSGENAMRRYHAYLGRLVRRFRHAKHDALSGETAAAHLRRQLFLGEYAVGEEFVARRVTDGHADWKSSIRSADPNAQWLALETGDKDAYHSACTLFGSAQLAREREFARLSAAASLAEVYQHGLSDRIGFTRFTWVAFSNLVARVVGKPSKRGSPVDLADVSGAAWH